MLNRVFVTSQSVPLSIWRRGELFCVCTYVYIIWIVMMHINLSLLQNSNSIPFLSKLVPMTEKTKKTSIKVSSEVIQLLSSNISQPIEGGIEDFTFSTIYNMQGTQVHQSTLAMISYTRSNEVHTYPLFFPLLWMSKVAKLYNNSLMVVVNSLMVVANHQQSLKDGMLLCQKLPYLNPYLVYILGQLAQTLYKYFTSSGVQNQSTATEIRRVIGSAEPILGLLSQTKCLQLIYHLLDVTRRKKELQGT